MIKNNMMLKIENAPQRVEKEMRVLEVYEEGVENDDLGTAMHTTKNINDESYDPDKIQGDIQRPSNKSLKHQIKSILKSSRRS